MARKPRQIVDGLILALARGEPAASAAKAAGVSVRTVWRRLADPAFRRRVSAARARLTDSAAGVLADATVAAAERLRTLLDSTDQATQLRAARAILELSARLAADDVDERLRQLEARVHHREDPAPPTIYERATR